MEDIRAYFSLFIVCFVWCMASCSNRTAVETGDLGFGVNYIITHNNIEADRIKPNYYIKARQNIYINDNLVSSSEKGMPMYQVVVPEIDAYEQKNFTSLLLLKASKGDSIYFQQNLDSTRSYAYIPTQEKGYIKFHIKVLDVFSNRAEVERDQRESQEKFKQTEISQLKTLLENKGVKAEQTKEGVLIERLSPAATNSDKVSLINQDSCELVIRYEARLIKTFNVFDENYSKPKPFIVKLNTHQVIPGFEIALKNMSVGETIYAYIPSMLAYRELGSKLREVPPFESVVFKITLEKMNRLR